MNYLCNYLDEIILIGNMDIMCSYSCRKRGIYICKFFSLRSDGAGKPYYFDSVIRKTIISGELNYETDSHTSIADYFGFKGKDEDMLNAYEYNPITKEFVIDRMLNKDDSAIMKEFCLNLDFRTIVPELVVKPIINQKNIIHTGSINDSEIALLTKWASVRASVRASVGDLVKYSVRAYVRDSIWASVRDLVGDSVWDSIWASVRDSIWAYVSSFFNLSKWRYIEHKECENPFQSCIDLWMLGLVPSFDGKIWRLHNMSQDGKIIYKREAYI